MFEKFSKKIGFTETEIIVILFLSGLFLIGFVFVEFIKDNNGEENIFVDYTKEDSLFAFYSSNGSLDIEDKEAPEKDEEIKKQVLELQDNFSYEKKDIESLKEKSININTAGVDELVLLPGIGEKTAKKIIEFRTESGTFKRLDELMEVKGIGEVKFNKIKKFLYIE